MRFDSHPERVSRAGGAPPFPLMIGTMTRAARTRAMSRTRAKSGAEAGNASC
jgi:hypothetical protein